MGSTDRELAAQIVRDAGGRIVGRTKMQKLAFLLEVTGLGAGFHFEYKHFGPYSEELTSALRTASAFGLLKVEERQANWGGWYSTYLTDGGLTSDSSPRLALIAQAAELDAVDLELAATAAYLSLFEGYPDPWRETERRKADKAANGGLDRAKAAYRKLAGISTPRALPTIA